MEELVLYAAPKGFKFVPTDAELITHYLMAKIKNTPLPITIIGDVSLYHYSPLQLSEAHNFNGEEMYFFTSRERKDPNGNRPKRLAGNGYWKVCKAKMIEEGGHTIGFKNTLNFFEGSVKQGRKTNWLMHEYIAPTTTRASAPGDMKLNDWVLCKIYKKKTKQNGTEKEKDEARVSGMDVGTPMSTTLYSPSSSAAEYFDSLPPGFLFSPSDKELVVDYLREKISNRPLPTNRIHVVDLYKHNPQQLTDMHKLHREDAWYFFTGRDLKYPKGSRPINRSVPDGYWKHISSCHEVMLEKDIVGYKRVFDFFEGKQPKGKRTSWKMHEYTIHNPTTTRTRDTNGVRSFEELALCKIYLNRTCRKVEEQEDTEKPDSDTTQEVLNIQDHDEEGYHRQLDGRAGSSSTASENYYYGGHGSSSSATFNNMPSSNGFEADHSLSTNDGRGCRFQ